MTETLCKEGELVIILTIGFLRGLLDQTSTAPEIRAVPGYKPLGMDFSDEKLDEFLVLAKMAHATTSKAA